MMRVPCIAILSHSYRLKEKKLNIPMVKVIFCKAGTSGMGKFYFPYNIHMETISVLNSLVLDHTALFATLAAG